MQHANGTLVETEGQIATCDPISEVAMAQQQIAEIQSTISLLHKRTRDLGQRLLSALRELDRLNTLPHSCRQRRCTYYTHYLAYGPADLTHSGFHAAEEKYAASREQLADWRKQNEGNGTGPEHMLRVEEHWGRTLRL